MTDKLFDCPFVQLRNRSALPADPMNQVLGRSNVPASCDLCIARLAQLLSKPIKQTAIWAVA
jgi:hypothetical protein